MSNLNLNESNLYGYFLYLTWGVLSCIILVSFVVIVLLMVNTFVNRAKTSGNFTNRSNFPNRIRRRLDVACCSVGPNIIVFVQGRLILTRAQSVFFYIRHDTTATPLSAIIRDLTYEQFNFYHAQALNFCILNIGIENHGVEAIVMVNGVPKTGRLYNSAKTQIPMGPYIEFSLNYLYFPYRPDVEYTSMDRSLGLSTADARVFNNSLMIRKIYNSGAFVSHVNKKGFKSKL